MEHVSIAIAWKKVGQVAWLCALLGTSGCSLIYDAGVFSEADAQRPPADVNVDGLSLTDTSPNALAEGAGCIPDVAGCAATSRGMPLVVRGINIAQSATVSIDGAGFTAMAVDATISSDGTMAAFVLSVPVMTALADGSDAPVTITVSQGNVTDDVTFNITGLDEFRATVDAAGGTFAGGNLRPMYSQVDFDSDVTFTGTAPVRIVATADINVAGTLTAGGANASGDSAGTGGPGGCDGGVRQTPGQCTGGGGGAGNTDGGGGGGGHGDVGGPGAGGAGTGGDGGGATGDATLTPLLGTGATVKHSTP